MRCFNWGKVLCETVWRSEKFSGQPILLAAEHLETRVTGHGGEPIRRIFSVES